MDALECMFREVFPTDSPKSVARTPQTSAYLPANRLRAGPRLVCRDRILSCDPSVARQKSPPVQEATTTPPDTPSYPKNAAKANTGLCVFLVTAEPCRRGPRAARRRSKRKNEPKIPPNTPLGVEPIASRRCAERRPCADVSAVLVEVLFKGNYIQ